MEFQINRETLLKPLQLVAGVVERRQTMPILSNILLTTKEKELRLLATDLEVELQGRVALEKVAMAGAITIPARKTIDICRTLPEQAILECVLENNKLIVRSGRSRFSLATLPAEDFPHTTEMPGKMEFIVQQEDLRNLIECTQFAMAQQDVRFYLNGMLWEVMDDNFRAVATDGHRMALSEIKINGGQSTTQLIVPRKAILELNRLLADATGDVLLTFGNNQLRIKTDDYVFTTKLIDGRFPDYDKVIPMGGDKVLQVDRDTLKQALSRVAILANERHRSIRFELNSGLLRIVANNPEQEEAEEELAVTYEGDPIEIGFNVNYLFDAVSALDSGLVEITLSNPDSSVRVKNAGDNSTIYVVMPMHL